MKVSIKRNTKQIMSTLSETKCPCVANEFRHRGNEFCESEDYEAAQACYNQSLINAEGESLALVYAQKASLSFKCQKFDECLKNIELARQSKMAEKKDLKCNCLSIMESNLKQLEFLQLSYPANKKLPFIVDCIELITNDKYGRHIITSKDLKVGDIVAIEKPYFISPTEDTGSCATSDTIKPFDSFSCAYCVISKYLNIYSNSHNKHFFHSAEAAKTCKELTTKVFHRNEFESTNDVDGLNCGLISRMARSMFSNTLELFDNSIEDLQDFLCENESHHRTIFDFDFSDSDETRNDKSRLLAMFTLIEGVSFSGTCAEDVAKFFYQLAWKIANEYTSIPLASTDCFGLYLFGSLLNHSCAPNVLAKEFDDKNVFFVIRPITEGQQLFISYG